MRKQTENFTMRISPMERKLLEILAHRFGRSQSDMIRMVIRELSKYLEQEDSLQGNNPPQGAGA